MAHPLMTIEGLNGTVELLADRVVIHRSGIVNLFKYGFHARREIPLNSIASVNFRDATVFKFGEIDFDYAGRSQFDRRSNSVRFSKKHQQEFVRLKDKIFELMMKARR